MENIPVTIRIPDKELHIIDDYVQEKGITRSDLLRDALISLSKKIEEHKQKDKLLAAAKKVAQYTLEENQLLSNTLEDNLNDN